MLSVVELVPRTDRDLVLARLASLVPDIAPLPVATTAPAAAEVLRVAGYGRTSTEWVPDNLATAMFSVQTSTATTFGIAGNTSVNASTCRGDAGGPAFRESASGVELLGVHSTSWQHGCLGETQTNQGSTETRVDDIASWFVRSPITLRWQSDANLQALIGNPTAPEVIDGQLRYQQFQYGRLYWTEATGVHYVYGAILNAYLALGGHPFLGAPTTDEMGTPDGVGRYNHFTKPGQDGSIYFTPNTGAHAVYGSIRQKWSELGWEKGLGYPTTDETGTPDGVGRYNHFNGGSGASIYFTPGTGANEVYGAIRQRWADLGWERSYLGYPTSGEFSDPGGRRNNFEHGYIHFDSATGIVTDSPY